MCNKINDNPNFINLKTKTVSLIPILNKYNFNDLVISVFCINSWIDNRSALENALALNNALVNSKKCGKFSISSYDEFKDFFEKILVELKPSIYDDLICNDFGEVKLRFKDRYYPIILGTGHENVFSALNFLPYISKLTEQDQLTIDCLNYNRVLLENLSKFNISAHDENDIRYECPTEAYFNDIKKFFETDFINNVSENLIDKFSNNLNIEKCHFVKTKNATYPLYNTSLLVDYFTSLLDDASSEITNEAIKLSLTTKIHNIYNTKGDGNPTIFWPATFIHNKKNLCSKPCDFIALASGKILIAICENEYNNKDLEELIQTITSIHEKDELVACEAYPLDSEKGCRAVNVSKAQELHFIIYNNHINISETLFAFGTHEDNYFRCTALDLMFFICFSEDLDELCDFIDYHNNEKAQLLVMGGKCNVFCNWKEQHKLFSKGAFDYNMLHVSYGESDDYAYKYYKNQLKGYPFNIDSHMFKEPMGWEVKIDEENDTSYNSKSEKGFWGTGYNLKNGGFIFFTQFLQLYNINDLDEHEMVCLRTINELHSKLINQYQDNLFQIDLFENLFLQISFLPWEYAKTVDNTGFLNSDEVEYVFSDISWRGDHPIIRFSVKLDSLMIAINASKDKSVESQYFYELMLPLIKEYPESFSNIIQSLKEDASKKKSVDVLSLEISFHMSKHNKHFELEDEALHLVRKRIAQICNTSEIQPGKFQNKDANKVIRAMQESLVSDFENEIAKYNKMDIHTNALSLYATSAIETFIHSKRYSSFSDVDENILHQVKDKTLDYREDSKRKQRYLLYLIESNLSVERDSDIICTKKQFDYLLAYANWLWVLQDNADYCYYNSTDILVEITSQFNVDVEASSEEEQRNNILTKRIYDNKDYNIKNDSIDEEFYTKAKLAFKEDIGLDFMDFCTLLNYLCREFTAMKSDISEIQPNVFLTNKVKLIEDFKSTLVEKLDFDYINSLIDFLTIDTNKIKEWKGEIVPCLPIWERENRCNRFDVKPIISRDENIIFSPVMCDDLLKRWIYGLPEFYPPYEIGLDNLKCILKDWKKRYENQMVLDINKLFLEKNFCYVKPEVELHDQDKKGAHPIELGDYDVIAVDAEKQIIYLIESKVIQKVGSIYEFSMQQKSFFFQNKYDEKFQTRIDYMKTHHSDFFASQNIDTKGFTIQPYMVVNKVFFPNEKTVSFPIISLYEFEQLIKLR